MSSQESSNEKHVELAHKLSSRGIWAHLCAEVDPDHSTPPLAAFSFMTGIMCDNNLAPSSPHPYLHSKVMQSLSQQFLCGVDSKQATSFRCKPVSCILATILLTSYTGILYQLSLTLARLFSGSPGHRDLTFHRADQQALTSLISFNLGASIGRFGDKMGAISRLWLVSGTFLQALFTMTASIAIWKSGQPGVAVSRLDKPAIICLRRIHECKSWLAGHYGEEAQYPV
jgi:hypothetical protein